MTGEEGAEEMIEWRSMSQEEMDEGWKKLAEIEEEVLDKYKVEDIQKRCFERKRFLSAMEACTKK